MSVTDTGTPSRSTAVPADPEAPGAHAVSRFHAGWTRDLVDAFSLFLWLRIGLSFLGLVIFLNASTPGPCHFEIALNGWSTIPPLNDGGVAFPLAGIWQRWDACWYTKIAAFGYETGADSAAFFPLFPLLTGMVGTALGGNLAVGGMVVSSCAYVAAGVGLLRLVGTDFGRPTAWRTLLYVSVFPAAFYLLSPFTEALFLALSVWTLYLARRRLWLIAAVLALLAGLTRTQGVLLTVPLAWEALMAVREKLESGGAGGSRARAMRDVLARLELRSMLGSAVAVAAPAGGMVLFIAVVGIATGSTAFEAQDAWGGRNFHAPWETISAAADWIANGSQLRGIELVNLSTLLLFLALGVAGLRFLPVSYSLLLWPQLLVVATRVQPVPLTSTTRLAIVMFPAFVVAAVLGRERRFHAAWLLVSTLLLGLLAAWFVAGEFVA